MTTTTKTGFFLLTLTAALVAAACSKSGSDMPAGDKSGSGTPTPKPGDQGGSGGAGTGGDPEKGDFTLEEATAGLAGTGALMAKISTPKGDIVCELFADKAPKTVANFVGLARGLRPFRDPKTGEWKKEPYFDGLAFHRVIPSFMIQGGDILSRDYNNPRIGGGGPGYQFVNENSPDLVFDKPGRLAMANAGRDTNGSQFFVTEVPKKSLDGGYTIFGQCEGGDVVKDIARVPVDSPQHNKPIDAITMRVEIFRR